jgi:hypothetical protein
MGHQQPHTWHVARADESQHPPHDAAVSVPPASQDSSLVRTSS